MSGKRILVVDDDREVLEAIDELLCLEGHEVATASSAEEGEARTHGEFFDLVITDLVMPGRSGIDLIRSVKARSPQTAALLITGHAYLQTAITALEAGAIDYLKKPIDPIRFRSLVRSVLDGERRVPLTASQRDAVGGAPELIFESSSMRAVAEKIAVAASMDAPILISAESGAGKESCARSIHARSHWANGPFIPLHLGAIAPLRMESVLFAGGAGGEDPAGGALRQAAGGTLFLDEIEALDEGSQLGLLASLDDSKHLEARLIVATGRPLDELVREGRFREELAFRLGAFTIELPPLRQRQEDLPLLIDAFLDQFSTRYGKAKAALPSQTLRLLKLYNWPGNVRELRSVIEHAVILCKDGVLEPNLLPRMLHRSEDEGEDIRIPIGSRIRDVERLVIERTLDAYGWNKNRTAKILGISRRSLYNKLERYQILPPAVRMPARIGGRERGPVALASTHQ